LNSTWVELCRTTHGLTHIVQSNVPDVPGLVKTLVVHARSAVDQHVLFNVPLGELKKARHECRNTPSTAYFLIPKHPIFNACTAGLFFIKEYPSHCVYATPRDQGVSAIQLYCSKPTCPPAIINTIGANHTMIFRATMGSGSTPPMIPVKILVDSGASHSFIDHAQYVKLKVPLTNSVDLTSTVMANGTHTPILGTCKINICIQGVVTRHSVYVCKNLPTFPLILGDDWLRANKALLDYDQCSVTLRSQKHHHILYAGEALGFRKAVNAAMSLPVLNQGHANKIRNEGGVMFLLQMQVSDTLDCDIIGLPPEDAPTDLQWPVDLPPAIDTLIHSYADVFGPVPPGLPPNESGPVITLIPGTQPPKSRPYRMTPAELECCHKEVKEKLASGHWIPSKSPFTSPVLFVTKKDGTLRLVHDQKKLNAVTVKQNFPIPRIDDIFDRLSGCSYFSCLDLTSAYSQLRLPEEEVERTSFVVPFGQYASRVLQFGLCNAPAAWSAVIANVFGPLLKTFVAVYLDDILIFSRTAEEHADHIRQVLEILRKAQLKVKLSKCSFCRPDLLYLGHKIGRKGLSVDESKVSTVKNWPVPDTIKKLQAFLGLSNYFRRFIKGYSSICAPLTSMTKQDTPWHWSKDCQDAFEEVKNSLCNAPVLAFPTFDSPFAIITDASLLGTGGILMQNEQPLCYTSSKFSPAELNYTTTDQELLAVVRALVEWRCYLEGGKHPVTICTDHSALTSLPTQNTVSRRQARWMEYLQRFNLVWRHIPGHTNMADPLSRCPGPHPVAGKTPPLPGKTPPLPGPPMLCVIQPDCSPTIKDLLIEGYAQDPWFAKLQNTKLLRKDAQMLWRINTPGKPSAIKVPNCEECRLAIMRELHDSVAAGHPGPQRTLHLVQRWFYWHGMAKYITTYASHCASCQTNKPTSQKTIGPLNPLPIPNEPWESVSMDLLTCLPETELGDDTIVVFVDRLTKYCIAVPCRLDIDAPGFANLLVNHVIAKHGAPLSLVSDRDVRFTSAFFTTLLKCLGTSAGMSTAFHPESDGQTERMNRLLQETLRHFVSYTQNDWDKYLQLACFAINNAVSASTGFSPFFLNFGRHPRHPSGVASLPPASGLSPVGLDYCKVIQDALAAAKKSLQRAQVIMKQNSDTHKREVVFTIGDKVLLSTKHLKLKAGPVWARRKFLPKYIGPFTVVSTVTAPYSKTCNSNPVPCAVKLDLPDTTRIHPVFNVSLLTHWRDPVHDPSAKRIPQPLDWLDGTPLFKVIGLVGHSWVKSGKTSKIFFKVKWSGVCDDTLEPRASLVESIEDDVLAYELKHSKAIEADRPKKTVRSKQSKTLGPCVVTDELVPPHTAAPSNVIPPIVSAKPRPPEQSAGNVRTSKVSGRLCKKTARYVASCTLFTPD